MSDNTRLPTAKDSFLDLREDLARALGIQTVDLLIDRAIVEIREAYPCIGPMTVVMGELDLDSLEEVARSCTAAELTAALNALTAVILLILARLLGRQVAQSIAESVDKGSLLTTVRL